MLSNSGCFRTVLMQVHIGHCDSISDSSTSPKVTQDEWDSRDYKSHRSSSPGKVSAGAASAVLSVSVSRAHARPPFILTVLLVSHGSFVCLDPVQEYESGPMCLVNGPESQAQTMVVPRLGPLVQLSSVAQSCLALCGPMDDCSTPGFPVHHHLLEFTQTHVHRVRDAIQPSHPLSSPSPPAFNLSQHQGLFQ